MISSLAIEIAADFFVLSVFIRLMSLSILNPDPLGGPFGLFLAVMLTLFLSIKWTKQMTVALPWKFIFLIVGTLISLWQCRRGEIDYFFYNAGVAPRPLDAINIFCFIGLFLSVRRVKSFSGAPSWTRVLFVVGAALATWRCWTLWVDYLFSMGDIGFVTFKAINIFSLNGNPYAEVIDPNFPHFTGFKYGLLMILGYLPFIQMNGARGIHTLNALLGTLTFLLLAYGQWKNGGLKAVGVTLIVFGFGRVVFEEISKTTDMLPTFLALAALIISPQSSLMSGILIGSSISTKLFPGALIALILIPSNKKISYSLGVLIGLVPVLVALVIYQNDFFRQFFLFPLHLKQQVYHWLPKDLQILGKIFSKFCYVSLILTTIYVSIRPLDFKSRCCLVFAWIGMLILSGSFYNRNYHVWWFPFFCLAAGQASVYLTGVVGWMSESSPDS